MEHQANMLYMLLQVLREDDDVIQIDEHKRRISFTRLWKPAGALVSGTEPAGTRMHSVIFKK